MTFVYLIYLTFVFFIRKSLLIKCLFQEGPGQETSAHRETKSSKLYLQPAPEYQVHSERIILKQLMEKCSCSRREFWALFHDRKSSFPKLYMDPGNGEKKPVWGAGDVLLLAGDRKCTRAAVQLTMMGSVDEIGDKAEASVINCIQAVEGWRGSIHVHNVPWVPDLFYLYLKINYLKITYNQSNFAYPHSSNIVQPNRQSQTGMYLPHFGLFKTSPLMELWLHWI